ncbi:MAG: FxLYD domain-containing protein [Candidatus Paceibacterota bacterium]
MDWAHKRKFIVFSIFGALVVAVAAIIGFSVFYHTPTCIDKKMNQDETGIDCGGSCSILCSAEVPPATVRFARTIIQSGRTDVIAYVDNGNSTAYAKDASMTLEAYKSDGTLVTARVKVNLPPRASVPVFIPGIASAGAGIRQAFLTFDQGSPVWMRGTAIDPSVIVSNVVTLTPETKPRITATLVNQTAKPVYNTVVTVTVFGADGEALAASQTIVPTLPAQGTAPMIFTWNEPFAAPVVRVDVVPTQSAPRIQL